MAEAVCWQVAGVNVMRNVAEQVTDAEMAAYARLIYDRTGIHISPQKKLLLSNRVRRRLNATGCADFSSYLALLHRLPDNDPEWDALLHEVTTHETYLFRDEAQWDWFSETYLREVEGAASAGLRPRKLRIWSAACSSGDEAYTIAACVAGGLDLSAWQVRILGTDIAAGAIEAAQKATFTERAMRLVPPSLRLQFFEEVQGGQLWQPRPLLTELVRFQQHNLLHPARSRRFDVVFLKNVLIYFDSRSKRVAMEHIRAAIAPGGWLVCGAAEGVSDLLSDYERFRPWLFRKPGGPRHG